MCMYMSLPVSIVMAVIVVDQSAVLNVLVIQYSE